MKIWYQSFTDWSLHASYLNRLDSYLNEHAAPGTQIKVAGLSPGDLAVHRISEVRCSIQALRCAADAQNQGYDAFVIGHFQDSGLDEARAMLDIPVIGMGETSMLYAMTLGRRFGLVTIDPLFADWHDFQAARISLEDRMVGVVSMSTPPQRLLDAFDTPKAYAAIMAEFVKTAESLTNCRAEVIIPAGGLFALLSAGEQSFKVHDAAVLNPILVTLRAAETAAWLGELNGTAASRAGAFAKPPAQAVEELMALIAEGARSSS
ncbi:MAG: hypothetical protein DLM61_25045 [Pseudonocardiales bacterium]|nr:MAG: hypothetical protein DLM61_25045 [Pseudonocardiales bacterium]